MSFGTRFACILQISISVFSSVSLAIGKAYIKTTRGIEYNVIKKRKKDKANTHIKQKPQVKERLAIDN
jgi:hypothetical protein